MRQRIQLIQWTGKYNQSNLDIARLQLHRADLVRMDPRSVGVPTFQTLEAEFNFDNPDSYRTEGFKVLLVNNSETQDFVVSYIDENGHGLRNYLPSQWEGKIPPKLYFQFIAKNPKSVERFQSLIPNSHPTKLEIDECLVMSEYLDKAFRREDFNQILSEVRVRANKWIEEVLVSQEPFWVVKLAHDSISNLFLSAEDSIGVEMESWDDPRKLWRNPEFQDKALNQTLFINRVYGWIGYFWQEFLWDLIDGFELGRCQWCGSLFRLAGHKDRKYCTREENTECHKARQRERTRRSRQKV